MNHADSLGRQVPGRTGLGSPWVPWFVFAAAIVASVFIHELGHCTVAWVHGYPAIPTPAKEYILQPLPEAVKNQVAFGGIAGSVMAVIVASLLFYLRPGAISSAILGGALSLPGFYILRFIIAGRGHDATEFQEAQVAVGLSYAGHSADWFFAGLFVVVALFWFARAARPTSRLMTRLVVGAVAALVVLALLQSINNSVFDRLLEPKAVNARG